MTTNALSKVPIQSTAGAVPVKNEKGELTMQKVKVNRYVTGKRPDYAPEDSSDEEIDDFLQKDKEGLTEGVAEPVVSAAALAAAADDRRLRRLERARQDDDDDEEEDRILRHQRRVLEPEVIGGASDGDESRDGENRESGESEEEDVDEEEVENRRQLLRERAKLRQQEEEVMEVAEDEDRGEGGSDDEESEYEEYTDSEEEEEETGPRLKPVFVRKKDRVTIQEKERQLLKEKELEQEAKRLVEERKLQARRLVEDAAKQELEEKKDTDNAYEVVNTDDENDEEEYESWKLRELRRLKRDKEERESLDKEKSESERLRHMTEDERKAELRSNPRSITNKAPKGKYKFLQKYYHRGAFYLDSEQGVFKRDYSAPTLDDHFDKTILPKVMQVKNFGRSGRTKYTHLVDQDTTSFDSPWAADTAQNLKFFNTKGGGMKQSFEKPTTKNAPTANTGSKK